MTVTTTMTKTKTKTMLITIMTMVSKTKPMITMKATMPMTTMVNGSTRDHAVEDV